MSTAAVVTGDPLAAVRWLDVVLVIAVAPFAILMGAPALGYLVGAVTWTLARVAGQAVERRARASANIKTYTGLTLFAGLGRAWVVGLAILLVGVLGDKQDGLTAALVAFVAFSIYLALSVATRPQTRKPSST